MILEMLTRFLTRLHEVLPCLECVFAIVSNAIGGISATPIILVFFGLICTILESISAISETFLYFLDSKCFSTYDSKILSMFRRSVFAILGIFSCFLGVVFATRETFLCLLDAFPLF